jgi:hypothetical protein
MSVLLRAMRFTESYLGRLGAIIAERRRGTTWSPAPGV